ncbi:MAG: hypothetical protein ACFFEX_18290 [Candidatus Thorarchaeota archaeon]
MSGLIGALFGRYLSGKKLYLIIALTLGFVIGLFGQMGLVYPFYIRLDIDFIFYELFFLHPSFKLLDIPPLVNPPFTVPPIVHIIFVTASVGGVLLGYAIGNKLKPPMRVSD